MNRRLGCFALLALVAGLASAAAVVAEPTPAEHRRIERLIDAVAQRSDVRFIRNGSEYSAGDAAEFMRGKLRATRERVGTVHDFIDHCGTFSSTTGRPYQVRLPDGRTIASAEFLRLELGRIERR